MTVPKNGKGGTIDGFELSFTMDFGLMNPKLEGFGLLGSVSFTNSDIKDAGPANDITIPGLSEDVYNVTGYYENEHFSVRLSARNRSDFLGEVAGFGAGRDFRQVEGNTTVDGQASYFFSGKLTGLTLLFQVYNISDEPFVTFAKRRHAPGDRLPALWPVFPARCCLQLVSSHNKLRNLSRNPGPCSGMILSRGFFFARTV